MNGVDRLVVIQCRLASSRLPGKALLHVGGRPSMVLCAQRAANSGLPVLVATSDHPADDAVVLELAVAGIASCRGPLDDVLQRFVLATQSMADTAIVVRLTADNLFPDGEFIEGLLRAHAQGKGYLGTSSPDDGLPYGMSAEVFEVSLLRAAAACSTTASDREHVTPWMRRQPGARAFVCADAPSAWRSLRCTLDLFADYLRLLEVFEHEADPVGVPWRQLVGRLGGVARRSALQCPSHAGADGRLHSAITLGTAQLGLEYGVANRAGMPDDSEASALLEGAVEAGIKTIDTARVYGRSEARIGRLLSPASRAMARVVTKLNGLAGRLESDASSLTVRNAVDASVFASTHALQASRIDTLLLHRWADRHAFGGEAWARLLELREEGVIGRLGASVGHVSEALEALADLDVQHLQLPVNLLDWRWRSRDFLAAVEVRPDVALHARSVLLQGLLTLPDDRWPDCDDIDASVLGADLDHWVRRLDRTGRVDLCVAYVRSLPWVTSLVMGMESTAQLEDNLALVQRPVLTLDERSRLDAELPRVSERVLDPSQWRYVHV